MNLLFRIRRRYLLALFAIAAIITSYTLLVFFQLEKSQDDAVYVNRAGQQRMLSQKIALYVFQLNDLYKAEQNAENQNLIDRNIVILRAAIERLEENHNFLLQRDRQPGEVDLAENLASLYFTGTPSLDERTDNYIEAASKWLDISKTDRQIVAFQSANTETMLKLLDQATKMFEQNSVEQVIRLRNFELFLWALTIVTLCIELLYIFRPMEKMVLQNFKQIELQKKNATQLLQKVQQANSAKDVFMTKMNHELRTPINGIKSSLHLMDKGNLTESQQKDIDTAVLCTEDLLFIYTEIVDFSLLTAGDFEKELSVVELEPFLNHVFDYFEVRTAQKRLNLSRKFDLTSGSAFQFDKHAVQKILYHLLYNALKYTPKGGIELTASTYIEKDGHAASLNITLTDTGYGMSEEQVAFINHAFQSGVREIYVEGMGLGLMACQNLVTLLKADFTMRSVKMEGTSISLSIPMTVAENSQTMVDEGDHGKTLIDDVRRSVSQDGISVLLVEDMIVNQQVTALMLEKRGMRCEVANNGQEALDKLKNDSSGKAYQLILMDIQMPIMDGIEATKKIRSGEAGEAHRETPIVALTAHAIQSERHACFDAGMNAFLTKPIQVDQFYSTIQNWVAE